jgi:LCP family protein required for cell wall assembly
MRKRIDKKRILLIGLAVLAAAILVLAALILIGKWEENQGRYPEFGSNEDVISYKGVNYTKKKDLDTFLVIGLDKFEGANSSDSYNNDQQADFIMLFVFDHSSKKYSAIHVDRDTIAKINVLGVAGNSIGTVNKQIALSHTYGNGRDVSCRNTADAVSEILMGVRVNHYISLKLDSVSIFNDLVGGVEVTVLDDFTGVDNTLVKGETVTLMGEQALTYVRSRHGMDDSSNGARMKRQQQYLRALYDKTCKVIEDDENFIVDASLAMSDYIISDRSVTQLQELAKKMTSYEFTEVHELQGRNEIVDGLVEFYSDTAAVKQLVIDLFYSPKKR